MTDRKSYRRVLSASTLTGDDVYNRGEEQLGTIEDLMIDTETGQVAYAVLSTGGFLGVGDKLFAVPWRALRVDEANKHLILDIEKDRLKEAEGFDKSNWPDMTAAGFQETNDRIFLVSSR